MNDTVLEHTSPLASMSPVDPEIEAMSQAGVHLGHLKSKNHPSMKANIFGVRNTISIIDLLQTKEALAKASALLKSIAAKKGIVLLVGTRPAARGLIRDLGEKSGMPYFTERWIGGTLTNFKVIAKRVEHMQKLSKEKDSPEFEKYTKWERMRKLEELARLERFFGGIKSLTRLPDAVFVVDITHDDTAVREAKRVKVPVIALVDTNSDATSVDHPIPANDDAPPALRYMIGKIGEAIEEGAREASRTEEAAQA